MHYGTLIAAEKFFQYRLHNYDWVESNIQRRTSSLVEASDLIDQFDYLGSKYSVAVLTDPTPEQERLARLSQPREFPRGTVNELPKEIETATYLIAIALLSGRVPDADLESLAKKSTQYGDLKTTYNREGNNEEHIAHLIPSAQAWNLIKPFLRENNSFHVKRV
jgi:hypothetical protein